MELDKSFGCISRLSYKKPIENICKGKAKLGKRLDEPSVYHTQAVQLDFLLLV